MKIAEEQQKYPCFRWSGKIYQLTCHAKGVSEGPRLFTKLMKPVFSTLRMMRHTITSFTDDTLVWSNLVAGSHECMHDTVRMLQRVGFCINVEESVLVPTKRIEYLRNIIDSETMTVTLPERRKAKICSTAPFW